MFYIKPYIEKLEEFCRRWRITEVALFGSALRDDFGPDSDIDLLARFEPEVHWTILDHVQMEDELAEIFGRKVDLWNRMAVEESENPYRKKEILNTARVIFTA
ncbi:MAG TPA: nucleotidyltransferase family protein [bacterium]|jgi:predicted nucleotidyltransferase|nr:nucleotidyltransferase family protein [bacterium]